MKTEFNPQYNRDDADYERYVRSHFNVCEKTERFQLDESHRIPTLSSRIHP